MAISFFKSLFKSKQTADKASQNEGIGDLSASEVADISSREYIHSLIMAYDSIRNDMMAVYFKQSKQQAMQIANILHELASPIFYAWEFFGYGKMGDFWKEDLAIKTFNEFKSSNVLEETRSTYNSLSVFFPLNAIDKDGNLKKCTLALLKVLIGKMERL